MSVKYDDVAQSIIKNLEQYKDCYTSDLYLSFKSNLEDLKRTIEDSEKEGRALKIGIVGQVKAGKSSFLNAVLFGGRDVLPQASTPMTAALTKISYREQPGAKIIFYSVNDWESIKEKNREYEAQLDAAYEEYKANLSKEPSKGGKKVVDKLSKLAQRQAVQTQAVSIKSKAEMEPILKNKIGEKLTACHELVLMFNASKENLASYLGKSKEITVDDIKVGLHDYVGADGVFTPIVKHVELYMNEEILKDVEIVDTPGLNDPITSRTEITRQFLRECDVAFLLSYTGQFLTQEDLDFMCRILPGESIEDVVIIGSKFDSGLLDDNKSKTIKEAYNQTTYIYNNQAKDNLNKMKAGSSHKERLDKLISSLPPKYVSSYLYGAALRRHQNQPYTKDQEFIISRLKQQFVDFKDDVQGLLQLAGILDIQEQVKSFKSKKEEIIARKNADILKDNKLKLLSYLKDIGEQAQKNKNELGRGDIATLEANAKKIQEGLSRSERAIQAILQGMVYEVQNQMGSLKNELNAMITGHSRIDVEHEKYETPHTWSERKWTNLWRKTEHRVVETIHNRLVRSEDAIDNIRSYITEAQKKVNDKIDKVIDYKVLEKDIKEAILKGIDTSDDSFDEDDILIPLKLVTQKIKASYVAMDINDFTARIAEQFPDEVKNEKIHELVRAQSAALSQACKELAELIDENTSRIAGDLTSHGDTFVSSIKKKIDENLANIKKQMSNKEEALRRYDHLLEELATYQEEISDMEM